MALLAVSPVMIKWPALFTVAVTFPASIRRGSSCSLLKDRPNLVRRIVMVMTPHQRVFAARGGRRTTDCRRANEEIANRIRSLFPESAATNPCRSPGRPRGAGKPLIDPYIQPAETSQL